MPLENLITRLEVTPEMELFVSFRGLGGIYYPEWKHLFPTHILGKRESRHDHSKGTENKAVMSLLDTLKSTAGLEDFKVRVKDKYFFVVQAYGNPKKKDILPKEFIRGHYTWQARRRLSCPGKLVPLDQDVITVLYLKRAMEQRFQNIYSKISDGKKPNSAKAIVNSLDCLFDTYVGNNFAQIAQEIRTNSTLRKVGDTVLNERKQLADEIMLLNQKWGSKIKLRYAKVGASSREHYLRLEQSDYTYLSKSRTPHAEELLAMKWVFLDIEIPFFRRDNPMISWIGVKYYNAGKIHSELHTIHDLGVDIVNDYKIIQHPHDVALVAALTKEINIFDPTFVSAYNARFDLIKLRDSVSGFFIGDRRKSREHEGNPVYKVTTPFFERIGIHDRFVIDLMRVQKIKAGYEINAKLETAAQFEKDIDYDEMEHNEDICLVGGEKGRVAARQTAHYVTVDVDRLFHLFDNQGFRENLEDVCHITSVFNIAQDRLLHTPTPINEVQEEGFFRRLGVYREDVPPNFKTKEQQYEDQKARERFSRLVVQKKVLGDDIKGLSQDVIKAYIPVGDFFEIPLKRRFERSSLLHEYTQSVSRENPQRAFFLAQYTLSLAKWMITDYGLYLEESDKLDEQLSRVKISDNEFEKLYQILRLVLQASSADDLIKLDKAKLSSSKAAKYIPLQISEQLRAKGMSKELFVEMANQRSSAKRYARRFLGNYDVFPSDRFFDVSKWRESQDIVILENILDNYFEILNHYLEDNSLKIVARQGFYLYLTGDPKPLEKKTFPLIMVDRIPILYNAHNPYYFKNGFCMNLKLKDEPDFHMCTFEMGLYGRILKHLMQGENQKAENLVALGMNMLAQKSICIDDLLFFNKGKDAYFAYATNSPSKSKKLYFVTHPAIARGPLRVDTYNGLQYFIDPDTIESADKPMEKISQPIRIYVMEKDALAVDYRKYILRFSEKTKELLEPISLKNQQHQVSLL